MVEAVEHTTKGMGIGRAEKWEDSAFQTTDSSLLIARG